MAELTGWLEDSTEEMDAWLRDHHISAADFYDALDGEEFRGTERWLEAMNEWFDKHHPGIKAIEIKEEPLSLLWKFEIK